MWRRRRGGSDSKDEPARDKRPSADDFTPEAVRREVFQQTLQHPATVLPLAVGLVAGLWSAVIGVSEPSLALMLASGFVATSAWIVNFFVRGEDRAARHVRELRERRAAIHHKEGSEIVELCERAGFAEGAKEARDLQAAFAKLRAFLDKQGAEGENLSVDRFRVLAEDSHQDGVRILRRALSIHEALGSIDVRVLVQERDAWLASRAGLPDSERAALDRRIESHTKRVDLFRERERVLPLLLAEANEIETALENAHLAAVDLVGEGARAPFENGRPATELEAAVQAARRVEERLRDLGTREQDHDHEYIEAAKRASS